MITIITPTLDVDKAYATGELAIKRAGLDCDQIVIEDWARSGFTHTVNRGLDAIKDGDVCILVDDCEPEEGWLLGLQEAVYERQALKVWFAGPSGPCRTYPQAGGRKGDQRRPRVVQHLAGFCLYVTRDCLDELGGLDERFYHYGSDVDWQRRAARDYGATSLWVPGCYVGHKVHPPHQEWWEKDQALLQSRWGI